MKAPLIIFLISLFIGMPAFAGTYEVGQSVPSFQAKDQHERDFVFDPMKTRFLLVSHDMAAGKSANSVLTEVGSSKLAQQKVVYVANIVGMPSIGRMFALPKMKKYNHQIVLGDNAEWISKFPSQEGKVTVLSLSEGKITSIRYWTPGVEALKGFLK